ncbi:hypothetical protein R2F25_18885 [Streptomyces sp. UP1A-1]|nr:hypothetical protein [Streptomyces sp. UP1A-1]
MPSLAACRSLTRPPTKKYEAPPARPAAASRSSRRRAAEQRVTGPGGVAGGHEAEARDALEVVQAGAEGDVLQPGLGGAADGADAERRPPVHALVDRDDVPGLDHLVAEAFQRAVRVPVQAVRQPRHTVPVRLHVQLGRVLGRAAVGGGDREGAEVVVLLGDVQGRADGGEVAERRDGQAVTGEHLLEDAQHVTGLELQDLPDVVLVDGLDGPVPAEEVHQETARRAVAGALADAHQGVVDGVVVVHAGREARGAARLHVQLGRVEGAR